MMLQRFIAGESRRKFQAVFQQPVAVWLQCLGASVDRLAWWEMGASEAKSGEFS